MQYVSHRVIGQAYAVLFYFILTEDILFCFSAHNKTPPRTQQQYMILVPNYGNMFRPFFRPSSGLRTEVKGVLTGLKTLEYTSTGLLE